MAASGDEEPVSRWEASLHPVIVLDGNGHVHDLNGAALDLYGWSREEVMGKPVDTLLLGDEGNLDWAARISGVDEEPWSGLEAHTTRRGVRCWVRASLAPLEMGGWLLHCCRASGRDVVRALYGSLLPGLEEAIALGDIGLWSDDVLESNGIHWSDKARDMVGIAPDTDMNHEALFEHVHPDDQMRLAAGIQNAILAPTGINERLRIGRQNYRHLVIFGHVLRDQAGTPLLAVGGMRDETELVHARERIAQLEAQLLQSQKMEAMGRVAGGVAHDFNNLLTAIFGHTELTLLRKDLPPDVRERIGQVLEAAQRASELTQQLLAFSRKQALQFQTVDLDALVESSMRLLRRIVREDVHVTVDAASESRARVDAGQLSQVLTNLVVNAADAMPQGGTVSIVTGRTLVEEEEGELPPGEYVTIAVSDEGTGIPDDAIEHVFEPFFTTKPVGQGTGLGLSTVHGIVQQHHGDIAVVSRVGAGTTFTIRLPSTDYFPRGRATPPPQGHAPARLSSGEVALVVEDEDMVRVLTRRFIEEAGFRVLEARNGEEALELIAREKVTPSLLLTDVIMPKVAGPLLVQRLRATYPLLPVLYVSGYPADIVDSRITLGPLERLVAKPYSRETLLAAVVEVLHARESGSAEA